MLLGGRSAEEIAFGEISTGAQNDLQRATDIARAMVTEFGMSDALGAVNYNGQPARRSSRTRSHGARQLRRRTAQKIDAEVKRILTERTTKAAPDPARARDVLDELSARLLEKEVIEAEELKAIMLTHFPNHPTTATWGYHPPSAIAVRRPTFYRNQNSE